MTKVLRPIALYLPQFHPISENDEWWGKGFTEWRNVVRAGPRFPGHYQPHLPSDLGFYDLRIPEVREEQARLAAQFGVHGFCYYHYWFNGRRVLERPFQEVFESGRPDFPFMLAWANENWTRVWDGGERDVLLLQDYTEEDHVAHITSLIPYFKDKRYIRVGDRPVFAIYKDDPIPDIESALNIFREVAREHSIELYLCRFDRDIGTRRQNAEALGFDAAIEFQPLSRSFGEFKGTHAARLERSRKKRRKRRLKKSFRIPIVGKLIKALMKRRMAIDRTLDMNAFVDFDLQRRSEDYKCYPAVCPSWDNSARRAKGRAQIFVNSSPDVFLKWVMGKASQFEPYSEEENFLFVNAWNEWAEGNHLEPCEKYGYSFLEALRDGLVKSGVTVGSHAQKSRTRPVVPLDSPNSD